MESEIQINNTAGVCQIDIEGTIGVPEEWQFEEPDARVATYERFRDTLRRIAEIEAPEVVVNIRSTGGDVNDALLIYDALAALDAEVTTRCYGYVASAATLIAQAASEGRREISAGALYLVHAAACAAEGNAAELEARAKLLRKTDERLAAGTGARADGEGQDAEQEGQRGHQNGTQAHTRRLNGRLDEIASLVMQLLGEFNDQNGVLRRQTNGGEQAHLEVHVVGKHPHVRRAHRGEPRG